MTFSDRLSSWGRSIRWRLSLPLVRFSRDPRHSDVPPDFLIVGLQKSGTYWLTNLLDSHPDITCFPTQPSGATRIHEGHFFDTLGFMDEDFRRFRKIFSRKHEGMFRDLVPLVGKLERHELFGRFRGRYNSFVQQQKRSNTRLVGEKTPEYVFYLELIEQLYPGMKKLCIVRNHSDRIISFHHQQRRKGRWKHESVEDWEVRSYCERIQREYRALLAHAGSIRLLSYEQLTAEPEVALTAMLTYLGVEESPELLAEMIERGRFERLAGRARGHSDTSSHFRKGVVGEGKEVLTPDQREEVHRQLDDLTRRMMERFSLDLSSYLDAAAASAGGSRRP